MTRINAGILVSELTDKHLLAEHREIKRVCHRLSERCKSNKFSDIPTPFHVVKPNGVIAFKELFWLDKGKYTYLRYLQLYEECKNRGFNVTNFGSNWRVYYNKPKYWNDYEPTIEQVQMIKDRITERLTKPLL
jgi:hypothetical protein